MIEPNLSDDIDHALWGRMTAVLVREGVRPRLATRLALALLPVVADPPTRPAEPLGDSDGGTDAGVHTTNPHEWGDDDA